MEENSLFVIDENGNEIEMRIIFTFDDPETTKKYVVFCEPSKEEDVFAMIYDDEGNLFPIEDAEEWKMVEEVLGAFDDEEEAGE